MIIDWFVALWRWPIGLWYARCRSIDLQILWPTCREHARDLTHAKAAFANHAFNDRAWLFLGGPRRPGRA